MGKLNELNEKRLSTSTSIALYTMHMPLTTSFTLGPGVNSLINIAFKIAYFVTSGSLVHSSKLYNGFILVAFDFC